MNRWVGKVAVVTGASAGIGAALVQDLAKAGVITIGLARRVERVEELKSKLSDNDKKNLHALKCDVSKESDIVAVFKQIEKQFGGVDILVNNAGMIKMGLLTDADNSKGIEDTINTNVLGLIYCTREAVQSMKKRSFDGHVVLINSVLGHKVPVVAGVPPVTNVYPATKHAVTAITETLRQEFLHLGTKIKISSVSPGFVHTEFVPVGDYPDLPILKAEDVSAAVLYVLGTPPHVQVHELIIKPVGETL